MQSKNNYVLVESLKPKSLLEKFRLWKIKRNLKPDQVLIESPKLEDLGFLNKNDYLHLVDILKNNPKVEKHLIDVHKNKIPDRYIIDIETIEFILGLLSDPHVSDNIFQKIVFSATHEDYIFSLTGAGSIFIERYISEFWEKENE